MRRTVKNVWRLVRVTWILGRYDALFLLKDAKIAPSVTWIAGHAPRRRGLGRTIDGQGEDAQYGDDVFHFFLPFFLDLDLGSGLLTG